MFQFEELTVAANGIVLLATDKTSADVFMVFRLLISQKQSATS